MGLGARGGGEGEPRVGTAVVVFLVARLKRECTHVTQRNALPTLASEMRQSRFIKFLTRDARHVQIFARRERDAQFGVACLRLEALNS